MVVSCVPTELDAARNEVANWQQSLEKDKYTLHPDLAIRHTTALLAHPGTPAIEREAANRLLNEASGPGSRPLAMSMCAEKHAETEVPRAACIRLVNAALTALDSLERDEIDALKTFFASRGIPFKGGTTRYERVRRELQSLLTGLNAPLPPMMHAVPPNKEKFGVILDWFRG
jgi:hypothetical protein